MSRNIKQVYSTNPITKNASLDLMYIGQSPYGVLNDAGIEFQDFANQFALNGVMSSVGTSSNTQLSKYAANIQILTGSQPQSFSFPDATTCSLGRTFYFLNMSSSQLNVADNGFNLLASIPANSQNLVPFVLIDQSTSNGTWYQPSHLDITNFTLLSTGVQIKGNNTNTAPPTGFLGEYLVSVNSDGTSLSNAVNGNITSLNLTAGIWDVSLISQIVFTGNPVGSSVCINTTSASFSGAVFGQNYLTTTSTSIGSVPMTIPQYRMLTTGSSTTVYLVANTGFSTGDCTGYGTLAATRVG